jgi:hypothetical protein
LLKLCQKLDITSSTFAKRLPHLSESKLKEDVFIGPAIRKVMLDEYFLLTMTAFEREAWIAFKSVVTKFLGNNKDLG